MKKFKLSKRNKRVLIQSILFLSIILVIGIDFLPLVLFILSAVIIQGLVSLYGNDPYFKDNEEKLRALNSQRKKINRIDPNNTYLGLKCYTLRKRIYGY